MGAAWDREYRSGRYSKDPPVPFVHDIVEVARREGLLGAPGVYIGCGNGRNYIPLLDAGMDITGVDVSGAAIEVLTERLRGRKARLVHGELSDVPAGLFGVVAGIQVFQHGSRATCHDHIRAAQRRVAPGGILAVRVNAIGTDIEFAHEVVEPGDERSGVTIRYLEAEDRSAHPLLRPHRAGGPLRRRVHRAARVAPELHAAGAACGGAMVAMGGDLEAVAQPGPFRIGSAPDRS